MERTFSIDQKIKRNVNIYLDTNYAGTAIQALRDWAASLSNIDEDLISAMHQTGMKVQLEEGTKVVKTVDRSIQMSQKSGKSSVIKIIEGATQTMREETKINEMNKT